MKSAQEGEEQPRLLAKADSKVPWAAEEDCTEEIILLNLLWREHFALAIKHACHIAGIMMKRMFVEGIIRSNLLWLKHFAHLVNDACPIAVIRIKHPYVEVVI